MSDGVKYIATNVDVLRTLMKSHKYFIEHWARPTIEAAIDRYYSVGNKPKPRLWLVVDGKILWEIAPSKGEEEE